MKTRRFLVVCGVAAIALVTCFTWRNWPADAAAAQAAAPSRPEQGLIDDLVLANRMLASQELGFVDAYGHVSVRSRSNPSHYFISRYVSPGIVTASDIIENDLDSQPVTGPRSDQYQERFLHGGIYKARPDPRAGSWLRRRCRAGRVASSIPSRARRPYRHPPRWEQWPARPAAPCFRVVVYSEALPALPLAADSSPTCRPSKSVAVGSARPCAGRRRCSPRYRWRDRQPPHRGPGAE